MPGVTAVFAKSKLTLAVRFPPPLRPMPAMISTVLAAAPTVPTCPLTLETASVLSTFCQTEPLKIAQSPIAQSAMPLRLVVPATLTT